MCKAHGNEQASNTFLTLRADDKEDIRVPLHSSWGFQHHVLSKVDCYGP